jgi:hypothetical protein
MAALPMMPRYYLHVRDGAELAVDHEGLELGDQAAARDEALRVGKQALAEHLKGGGRLSTAIARSIEIADEGGRMLSVVTYAEASEAEDRRPLFVNPVAIQAGAGPAP